MNPEYSLLGILITAYMMGFTLSEKSLSKTELQLVRLDKAEITYNKKINSIEYKKALAKRERKRIKLC